MSCLDEVAFAKRFSPSVILHALKLLREQSTIPCSSVALNEGVLVISLPEALAEAFRSSKGRSIFSVRSESFNLYKQFLCEAISSKNPVEYRAAVRPTFGKVFDCLREGIITDEQHPGWVHVIDKNWRIATMDSSGEEKIAKACNYLRNMVQ